MKNQIVKVKCIDITVDFYGVCKYEGLVIFVKGMLPDEEGDVKIIKIKKNIAYGIIDSLTVKSKYRIKETCPIAYKCGGCDIEHAEYRYQLILKKNLIINTFKNMKLDLCVNDVVSASYNYEYRNKMMVPVFNHKVGFYRNHSNDIVEFDNCYIESKISNLILNDLKILLDKFYVFDIVRHIVIRTNNDRSEYMVCLVIYRNDESFNDISREICSKYGLVKSFYLNINNDDTNVILSNNSILLSGNDYINDNTLGLSFRIPLNSFYQINNEQMLKLYQKIVEVASFNINDRVLDLFCGIGTISLYVSKYVKEVLGIELVKQSIDYANINKDLNHIVNVKFIHGDANIIDRYISNYNVAIIDPPRKGINSKLISTLINSSLDKVVYVSCNPATLARDLSLLKDYFTFSNLTPIDMFPNTKHIECVILLTRKNSK